MLSRPPWLIAVNIYVAHRVSAFPGVPFPNVGQPPSAVSEFLGRYEDDSRGRLSYIERRSRQLSVTLSKSFHVQPNYEPL